MKYSSTTLAIALLSAIPAFADVAVSSPAANSVVGTPFVLTALATPCSSQPVTAMGYSLDNSWNTAIIYTASLSVSVTASTGKHVLHVKSWGNKGASCTKDVAITIGNPAPAAPVSNLSVTAPAIGASLQSPFALTAAGSLCNSQPIAALGYSLDNSSSTTIVNAQTVNAKVSASAGAHLLHVKAWSKNGASCVADVNVTVVAPSPAAPPPARAPEGPSIPSTAKVVKDIQKMPVWKAVRDTATGGSSASASGSTSTSATPSISGTARRFQTTTAQYGGELYHVSIAPDEKATNFVYDTQVYIDGSSTGIANIEMDLNQVLPNRHTIIMGFQCDGWSGTWDYTINNGTPTSPIDHWLHSNQTCRPQDWARDTWHHVQVQYSRDDSGNVTYHSVWLDGVQQDLNVTVPSDFALGWAPTFIHNFQVDGMTSGTSSSTIYIDNTTIYSW